MKNIARYIITALMLITSFSCSDYLDLLPPNGLIRDEFWKEKGDAEAVLMAAYETFAGMDEKLFLLGEIRGDMLQAGGNQNDDEKNIMENNIYPDNEFCNWGTFYNVINYCNAVIKNAPLVQKIDNTFTDYQLKSILAEAYFLRSLSYFYLVRIYKEVPMLLEPAETDDVDIYLPKSSEEVVLDQIVSDLKSNREFAPSGSFATLEETKGRVSKAAYDALLADIELWRFNYNEVLIHVAKIEDTNEFTLMPSARWFEIYYPGNSLESIFEFQFDENLDQSNHLFSLTQRNSNRYKPSQKAVLMFGFKYNNEIVRGEDASIGRYGEDEYVVWKYVGQAADSKTVRSGGNQNSANWIIYRYADILLMKAEALAMLDRFSEARIVINKIRERAGVSGIVVADTKNAFEDAILVERASELSYEGKRWFDLLRLGRRNNYARKAKLIEVIVSNVPSTQKRVLAAKLSNTLGWYLPIYKTEIESNRNLDQNSYYIY